MGFKESLRVFQGRLRRVTRGNSRELQGCLKEVGRVFQGSFKEVSGQFKGSFKEVLRKC